MDRIPADMVYSEYCLPCISYPTFAQLLMQLDTQQLQFGWSQKFSQPLTFLLGGRHLDEVTIDSLYFLVPDSLCVVFELYPVWVMNFCIEVLSALEHARENAHHDSEEADCCHSCGGFLMRYRYLVQEC
ncbi:hypothetical protein EDD15DRAFT_2366924 [Pisolithus albus]|nr:hypothetical protein EDD15DRAFT_2366924 [Pisolithus albus]